MKVSEGLRPIISYKEWDDNDMERALQEVSSGSMTLLSSMVSLEVR